jgi:hypothetical protein
MHFAWRAISAGCQDPPQLFFENFTHAPRPLNGLTRTTTLMLPPPDAMLAASGLAAELDDPCYLVGGRVRRPQAGPSGGRIARGCRSYDRGVAVAVASPMRGDFVSLEIGVGLRVGRLPCRKIPADKRPSPRVILDDLLNL